MKIVSFYPPAVITTVTGEFSTLFPHIILDASIMVHSELFTFSSMFYVAEYTKTYHPIAIDSVLFCEDYFS